MTNLQFTIYNFQSIFNVLKPALPAGGFKHLDFNFELERNKLSYSNLKLKIKN